MCPGIGVGAGDGDRIGGGERFRHQVDVLITRHDVLSNDSLDRPGRTCSGTHPNSVAVVISHHRRRHTVTTNTGVVHRQSNVVGRVDGTGIVLNIDTVQSVLLDAAEGDGTVRRTRIKRTCNRDIHVRVVRVDQFHTASAVES